MGAKTSIAWTDKTWNPWWGCTKIEAPHGERSACDNCYAEALAKRYGHDVWGSDADRRHLSDRHWREPLKWNEESDPARPTLVFCASMGDVFEHRIGVDDLAADRARLFELIEATPRLVWQLLTKRPEWVPSMVPRSWMRDWPAHVWLGATVESERFARIRMPRLLRIPAPVLFVSAEPLLGDLSLWPWFAAETDYDTGNLGWLIVGGESGAADRVPLDHGVARKLRDECAQGGVPFFFKQDSGAKSGMPGPDDLMVRQFPAQAGDRTAA